MCTGAPASRAARRICLGLLTTLALALALPTVGRALTAADYLGYVEEATTCLERASPRSALAPLLEAQTQNGADPLVHLALGLVYLQLGGTKEATAAFTEAARWSREGGQGGQAAASANLGLGMALLAANQPAAAVSPLKQAGRGEGARACLALCRLLAGDSAPAALLPAAAGDSFVRAIAAAGLREAGRAQEAADILEPLARATRTAGFDPPPDARFLPRAGGQSEIAGETVPLQVDLEGSGLTTVTPRLPKGLAIAYVSLQVDGQVRGMTNGLPYSFRWRADEAGPGWHTLMVKAYSADGIVRAAGARCVLQGQAWVGDRYDPARYRALLGRLETLLCPQPHPAFVQYQLARAYLALGRRAEAIEHLEHCVAIYPQMLDARSRLLALYGHRVSGAPIDIKHGPRKRSGSKRIALTFDDGPHPAFTSQILSVLRKYQAKATFFMVGMQVHSFPELARDISADGHELANHTYTHPNLEGLGPIGVQQELLRTRVAIREVTGKDTVFFRPPGGRYNGEVRKAIASLGYRTVLWSSNILSPKTDSPRLIANAMLREIDDGGIVLLHNGRDYTTDVLPVLLPELKKRGYRFVTISELLAGS